MWDGLAMLLVLSLIMGAASFLAGLLPLSFGLSNNHSRVISSLGTGILVGTCLIVIIPEGIETLYDTGSAGGPAAPPGDAGRQRRDAHDHDHYEPHAWIGLALILGFILMYLIDKLPKHLSRSPSGHLPLRISLSNLSRGPHRSASLESIVDEDPLGPDPAPPPAPRSSATTIGLVIHAAADGIALGASSFIEKSSVGLVVFLAIMIHKAPAAFGLTSVLLKQGLSKRLAKAHLIVFSLAAPVGALATWLLVNIVAGGQIEGEEGTKFATGLLLIFSGGTFLYVAMHTMQDEGHAAHGEELGGHANGHPYSGSQPQSQAKDEPSLRDTLLVVLGMLLPMVAQVGHAH